MNTNMGTNTSTGTNGQGSLSGIDGESSPERLAIFNGTHTVSSPKGAHRTFRVRTALSGNLEGKRILELLHGPNNSTDFRGIGFVDDDRVTIWRNLRPAGREASRWTQDGYHWSDDWTDMQKIVALFVSLAVRPNGGFAGTWGYELLTEGRCVKCNRKLTTPESILSGIGPTCAGRE